MMDEEEGRVGGFPRFSFLNGMRQNSKKCEFCKVCDVCKKKKKKKKDDDNNCEECVKCDICKLEDGKKFYDNMMLDENKFFKKLSFEEKLNYVKSRFEIDQYYKQLIPVKYRILQSSMSIKNKSIIIERIEEFEMMGTCNGEYIKLKRWIDGVTKIPFEIYAQLSVNMLTLEDEKYNYLYHVQTTLNNSIYGQYDAKDKILQIVSQWISNPSSIGNVIALQGPPGIGKTTLIKDGLAKALDKPFNFMALGGAYDGTILVGHNYTYEGSTWGRIADFLMRSKCMNPIIYFDELDKLSSRSGNEVMGVLTHLIDPSQNNEFQDDYFAGIDLDLSQALYIFSYNDEANVNYILKDRITCIKMTGFSIEEKIHIARSYLIPSIANEIGLDINNILIEDDLIEYIIRKYTMEEGVRKLKQNLFTIYSKLNLLRFANHGTEINIKYTIHNFVLPIVITQQLATMLLEGEYYYSLTEEDKMEFIQRKEDIYLFNEDSRQLTEDSIINLSINAKSRSIILQKYQEFQRIKPDDHEYSKMNSYMTGLSKMPFGRYIDLPVNYECSLEVKSNYLNYVQNTLDSCIYGQQEAKNKILQIVAQWISNPCATGNIFALYGPPGTGKTSLIKDGLSKALNRPFNFIGLGGAQDSSILKGHSYTYLGAQCGKIVDMLMQSKCMNPIIYMDELDKISNSDRGQEITQVLTQLTDTTQNNEFQDVFYQGIDFDLSKVLFVFSYNDDTIISPVLKDRITRIKVDDYKLEDKIQIAVKHMIPKICEEMGLTLDDIMINEDIIKGIVNKYTDEKGVRKLKECLHTIYSKINLLKQVNQDQMQIEYSFSPQIVFPIVLTHDIVYKLMVSNSDDNDIYKLLYI